MWTSTCLNSTVPGVHWAPVRDSARRCKPGFRSSAKGIERGSRGEALAALHGLHVPPDDEPPCDVDEMSDVDEQEILRDKIVSRLIQSENTISLNRDLPDNVKERWIGILRECYPGEANSISLLRGLKQDMNDWREIDPESTLSLLEAAIGSVATMIEIYHRRFIAVQQR